MSMRTKDGHNMLFYIKLVKQERFTPKQKQIEEYNVLIEQLFWR